MAFSIVTFVRLAVLSTATFFSLIVLGTSAHILNATETSLAKFYWAFDAFAVAVSVLTLVTLPLLLIFSLISKGAFPNYVVVELAWLSVLWILWLASAGYSANTLTILPSGCSFNITFFTSATSRQTVNCGEFWALEAFSWLIWLILMPYTILLLVLTIIQHNRGNKVWTQCVHEVDFFAPAQPGMVPQPQVYTPQPMVQQPLPQQVPVQTNTGYAQPPANTGYAQAPVNTEYAQAPYVPAPGYTQSSPNPAHTQV